jgi:hypothetical protein
MSRSGQDVFLIFSHKLLLPLVIYFADVTPNPSEINMPLVLFVVLTE